MKKEIRYLQSKNDGLNGARKYVNFFLRDMFNALGRYDADRLRNMLLDEIGHLNILWDYEQALILFNECEEANSY